MKKTGASCDLAKNLNHLAVRVDLGLAAKIILGELTDIIGYRQVCFALNK